MHRKAGRLQKTYAEVHPHDDIRFSFEKAAGRKPFFKRAIVGHVTLYVKKKEKVQRALSSSLHP